MHTDDGKQENNSENQIEDSEREPEFDPFSAVVMSNAKLPLDTRLS